jgi:hypothetical protein
LDSGTLRGGTIDGITSFGNASAAYIKSQFELAIVHVITHPDERRKAAREYVRKCCLNIGPPIDRNRKLATVEKNTYSLACR